MRKIWEKIKSLVSKQFRFIKEHSPKAEVAIAVVNAFKAAVDSPVADILVNVSKTDLDNELLEKARKILPGLLAKMALAKGIIDQATSNADVYAAVFAYLQKMFPEGRKGFWVEFGGELTVALADGKLTFPEGTYLSQLLYNEFHS
jgi:hypothetical protein